MNGEAEAVGVGGGVLVTDGVTVGVRDDADAAAGGGAAEDDPKEPHPTAVAKHNPTPTTHLRHTHSTLAKSRASRTFSTESGNRQKSLSQHSVHRQYSPPASPTDRFPCVKALE
jgi:hypothetical protein